MPPMQLDHPTPSADAPDGTVCDVFPGDLETYGDGGYRRGYDGALRNMLASLVPLAEEHLRSTPVARRNVYAFIEFLERHIERISSDAAYVTDGLGI